MEDNKTQKEEFSKRELIFSIMIVLLVFTIIFSQKKEKVKQKNLEYHYIYNVKNHIKN